MLDRLIGKVGDRDVFAVDQKERFCAAIDLRKRWCAMSGLCRGSRG